MCIYWSGQSFVNKILNYKTDFGIKIKQFLTNTPHYGFVYAISFVLVNPGRDIFKEIDLR